MEIFHPEIRWDIFCFYFLTTLKCYKLIGLSWESRGINCPPNMLLHVNNFGFKNFPEFPSIFYVNSNAFTLCFYFLDFKQNAQLKSLFLIGSCHIIVYIQLKVILHGDLIKFLHLLWKHLNLPLLYVRESQWCLFLTNWHLHNNELVLGYSCSYIYTLTFRNYVLINIVFYFLRNCTTKIINHCK